MMKLDTVQMAESILGNTQLQTMEKETSEILLVPLFVGCVSSFNWLKNLLQYKHGPL